MADGATHFSLYCGLDSHVTVVTVRLQAWNSDKCFKTPFCSRVYFLIFLVYCYPQPRLIQTAFAPELHHSWLNDNWSQDLDLCKKFIKCFRLCENEIDWASRHKLYLVVPCTSNEQHPLNLKVNMDVQIAIQATMQPSVHA